MSLLSGPQIEEEIKKGTIKIDPFDPNRVNPNSVNLTLGPTLLVYQQPPWWNKWWLRLRGTPWCLDMARDNPTEELWIPPAGRILWPGELYLGSTVEYTETLEHVPRLDGRSSIGRLGICIHLTAAYGDVQYRGRWTLEITVVYPVRVYAGSAICQINYETVEGALRPYKGKYQDSQGAAASKMYEEISPK